MFRVFDLPASRRIGRFVCNTIRDDQTRAEHRVSRKSLRNEQMCLTLHIFLFRFLCATKTRDRNERKLNSVRIEILFD